MSTSTELRFCEVCCDFKPKCYKKSFSISIGKYDAILFRLMLCDVCWFDEDGVIDNYLIPACNQGRA